MQRFTVVLLTVLTGALSIRIGRDTVTASEFTPVTQGQAEQSEVKRIEARLKEETIEGIMSLGKLMLQRLGGHSDNEEVFAALGFNEEGPRSIATIIQRAGGLDAYRKRVTKLLKSENDRVRAFAAG